MPRRRWKCEVDQGRREILCVIHSKVRATWMKMSQSASAIACFVIWKLLLLHWISCSIAPANANSIKLLHLILLYCFPCASKCSLNWLYDAIGLLHLTSVHMLAFLNIGHTIFQILFHNIIRAFEFSDVFLSFALIYLPLSDIYE